MADKPKIGTKKAQREDAIRTFTRHLVGSATVADAAKLSGISLRSASRMLKNQIFLAEFKQLHRPETEQISQHAISLVIPALMRCKAILSDPEAKHTTALRALETFSTLYLEFSERTKLEETIRELEEQAVGAETRRGRM